MSIDYGSLPDWITAAAAGGGAWTAWRALGEWRKQLYGTSKHALAVEIATAAGNLCYEFYRLRSPLIEPYEFPPTYWRGLGDPPRTDAEQANGYQHAFATRWSAFCPHGNALADLRGKALMLLDKPVANAVEALAKQAHVAKFMLDQYVEIVRAGEGVRHWTDKAWVEKVRSFALGTRDNKDDPISRDFEKAIDDLQKLLRPYLHDN